MSYYIVYIYICNLLRNFAAKATALAKHLVKSHPVFKMSNSSGKMLLKKLTHWFQAFTEVVFLKELHLMMKKSLTFCLRVQS